MFKRLAASLCLVQTLAWPVPIAAQSQSEDIRPKANRVTGEALMQEFMGVTHDGAYNFTDDGDPRRFYRETHNDDGSTIYTEDGEDYDGVWMIRNDHLCFSYEDASMTGGCFRVYQVGNCFYYYSQLLPEYADALPQDYWTARSVKEGELPTCEPGMA